MATQVEICSAALMLLGDAAISSFADGTKRATLCATLYPLVRRDIMRRHNWNCLTKRATLSPLVDAPEHTWGYQFTKPADLLRLVQVGLDGEPEPYQFESNRILADVASLYVVYVADVSEGYWDALLVDVMTRRMAADLAYPVTASSSLAQLKRAEYDDALKAAKATDGQENPPESWEDSPFITARG